MTDFGLRRLPVMVNSPWMRVDVGIWDKLSRLVIFLLFLAGLLGLVMKYLPLIEKNARMRKEILRLEAQIKKEEETTRKTKAAIDSLCYDPKAVERLIRECWGFAKPGETIIKFEERKPALAGK